MIGLRYTTRFLFLILLIVAMSSLFIGSRLNRHRRMTLVSQIVETNGGSVDWVSPGDFAKVVDDEGLYCFLYPIESVYGRDLSANFFKNRYINLDIKRSMLANCTPSITNNSDLIMSLRINECEAQSLSFGPPLKYLEINSNSTSQLVEWLDATRHAKLRILEIWAKSLDETWITLLETQPDLEILQIYVEPEEHINGDLLIGTVSRLRNLREFYLTGVTLSETDIEEFCQDAKLRRIKRIDRSGNNTHTFTE
jgi:hypothetical protein